ncbi:hypothetical protein [Marinobacter sp.]|uniref:hypothetical protein n=1 Tax=Marinobacter sp. TaxID=50741 RepID=UPI003569D159
MKWLVLAIIVAIVAIWLYRGKRKNYTAEPEVKTFDEKDFYLTSNDNTSDNESSPDKNNPRH